LVRIWSTTTGKLLWSGRGTTENFMRIGHSLCALTLAWLGGKLSRRLSDPNRDVSPGPAQPR
jgi:hypothetical protein